MPTVLLAKRKKEKERRKKERTTEVRQGVEAVRLLMIDVSKTASNSRKKARQKGLMEKKEEIKGKFERREMRNKGRADGSSSEHLKLSLF